MRQLHADGFSDPTLVERRAELELTDGDAQVALRMYEDLVAQDPKNTARAEKPGKGAVSMASAGFAARGGRAH